MAPNVPTGDQPMFLSIVSLSSSCCFKGGQVSWRQTRYKTTCKIAERKYSTAFDKSEKPFVQEQGCLCRLPYASRKASCCATAFRPFPQNFRDFPRIPRLSATFREFPRHSASFRHFPHPSLAHPAIFRTLQIPKCHCMGVVALRSGACHS